ncbi:MAG: hypothetical protein IJO33_02330 [Bacilli bacterium]|nr:hypothetical protein [Bacilli bacterium]
MSKKKNKSIVETKEDKAIGTWMPIGVMIGTVVGCILSFKYDDMMFIGYGSVGGLLLGIIVGSILSEGDIKIEFKKSKRKTKKK